MKRFICNSKNIERDAYIWNTVAAMSNSFQTMLLMLVITRVGNMTDSSIFAIAYAIGNLMMSLGKYGMRNYQVTDVENRYSYQSYVFSRWITTLAMTAAWVFYIVWGILLGHYTFYKAACIGLICLVKEIDTIEDIVHGRLQQIGRLDIASKILSIRMLLYIFAFAGFYFLSRNLLLTELICFLISVLVAVYGNGIAIAGGFVEKWALKGNGEIQNVVALLKSCFPLAAGTFLIMYLGNAPKYMIDSVVSDEVQTGFNIVFMPVFVITLLSSFVFNPILGKVAAYWSKQEYKLFGKIVIQQCIIIAVITVCAIIFAWGRGIPVLAWIYKVNLKSYRKHLCMLMLAGGLLALLNLFNMVITAMRRQKLLLWVFGLGTVWMLLCGRLVLKAWGLYWLCIFYCLVLACICLALVGIIIRSGKEKNKYVCCDGDSEL